MIKLYLKNNSLNHTMKKGKKNKKPIEGLPKTQSSSHVIVNVKPTIDNEITDLPGYEKEVYNIPIIKLKAIAIALGNIDKKTIFLFFKYEFICNSFIYFILL